MAKQTDLKSEIEMELRQVRDHCQRGGVAEEIQKIRENVVQGNLSLADIGTTEEELRQCLKTGYQNSAKNWLQIAERDVMVMI